MKTKFLTLRSFTLLLVMALSIGSAWGAVTPATLPIDYSAVTSSDSYSETNGFKKNSIGSYSAVTCLKFDATGDYIILQVASAPAKLTYKIKNNSFSGGTFTVQTSTDGNSYSDIKTHTSISSTETININLDASVRYIKWIYTKRSSGNVGLGGIVVTAGSSVKHGVNWYVNGTKAQTDSVAEGAAITLPTNPTAPSSCSSKSFYGWTTSSSYSHATDAPEIISSPTMDKSDLNYYAVFADKTTDPNYYKKGSTSDLVNDQIVVIHDYSNNVALTTEGYSTQKIPCISVTPNDNKIPTSSITDKMKWTVGVVSGKYTFRQGTSYLMAANSYLKFGTSPQTQWTLTSVTNGYNFSQTDQSSYPYINNNSSSKDITSYSSSAATLNVFVPLVTYSNYVTTCKSCEHLITITKGTPEHGSFEMTGAGSNICVDDATASVSLSNITADSHYHATAVTTSAASGGGTPSAISDGSATVTGISATTTINVTFEEDTKYTVTFFNNGKKVESIGTSGVKTYYAGETLGELPGQGDMEPCHTTSTTFMGWMNSDTGISTPQKDAPTMVTSSTVVNADMTLRAVWAKAQ